MSSEITGWHVLLALVSGALAAAPGIITAFQNRATAARVETVVAKADQNALIAKATAAAVQEVVTKTDDNTRITEAASVTTDFIAEQSKQIKTSVDGTHTALEARLADANVEIKTLRKLVELLLPDKNASPDANGKAVPKDPGVKA